MLTDERDLLSRELKKKGIEPDQLADGVCSYNTIKEILNGRQECDLLLFFFFLQRLGESPDKKEYILSWKEYQGECIRSRIVSAIFRGRREWAKRALCDYKKKIGAGKAVHEMFVYRGQAMFAYWISHDAAEAKRWLEQALNTTFPRWKYTNWDKCRISTMELENLLAYTRIEQDQEKEVEGLLKKCGKYIENYITDSEEHAKIYSKYAWIAAREEVKKGYPQQALKLCETAINELGKHSIAYFVQPLLRIMLECYEMLGTSDTVYQGKLTKDRCTCYLNALEVIYHNYGKHWMPQDSILWNCSQKAYHLETELIAAERKAFGMTQAELSAGIYENAKEIGKIERGLSSPRQKRFSMLMERFGIERERRSGFVITNSYLAMKVRREIQASAHRHQYDKMNQQASELEKLLDMQIPENQQTVKTIYNMVAFQTGERSPEDILAEDWKLLQMTYHISPEDIKIPKEIIMDSEKKKRGRPKKIKTSAPYFYRVPFKSEVDLLNQIAILLKETNQKEEAIQLYEKTIAAFERSKVKEEYQYFSYGLLSANLARDKDMIENSEKGIRHSLQCGKFGGVCNNYLTLACTLFSDSSNQELCQKMVKECYYLFELSESYINQKNVKNFYKNTFECDIEDS